MICFPMRVLVVLGALLLVPGPSDAQQLTTARTAVGALGSVAAAQDDGVAIDSVLARASDPRVHPVPLVARPAKKRTPWMGAAIGSAVGLIAGIVVTDAMCRDEAGAGTCNRGPALVTFAVGGLLIGALTEVVIRH